MEALLFLYMFHEGDKQYFLKEKDAVCQKMFNLFRPCVKQTKNQLKEYYTDYVQGNLSSR